MRASSHIVAAIPFAAVVGLCAGSVISALLAGLSSILIDLDHVVDYVMMRRSRRGVADFFATFAVMLPRHYFFLHGWEWAGALVWCWMAGVAPQWAGMIGLGMAWHLGCDQWAYRSSQRPLYYFFIFRAINGFDTAKLFKPRHLRNLSSK